MSLTPALLLTPQFNIAHLTERPASLLDPRSFRATDPDPPDLRRDQTLET